MKVWKSVPSSNKALDIIQPINITHLDPGQRSWSLYWHIVWSAIGCCSFPVCPALTESCTERSCKMGREQMLSRSGRSRCFPLHCAHPDVSGARYQARRRGTAPIPVPPPQEHSQSKRKTIGRERQSSWESFSVVSGRKWQSWMDLMTLETPLCSLDSVNILNVSNAGSWEWKPVAQRENCAPNGNTLKCVTFVSNVEQQWQCRTYMGY